MLFTSAKISISRFSLKVSRNDAAAFSAWSGKWMPRWFWNCTNTYECEAACPAEVSASFISKMNREYASASLKERVGE
jgi:succinate dehydrogenase / fumarate reductase iron-sulfur subunit